MNKLGWKKALYLAIFLILVLPIFVSLSFADNEANNNGCLIEVDAVVYDTNPCNFYDHDGDVLRFGKHFEDGGYWVYILSEGDGLADMVYWNGEAGASHAHNSLGLMKREGSCWMNERAKLCVYLKPFAHDYNVD